MKVQELMEYLKGVNPHKEIKFTDVCGNWVFYLYTVEQDENVVYIVGDEE